MSLINLERDLMVIIGNFVVIVPPSDQELFLVKFRHFVSLAKKKPPTKNYIMNSLFKTPVSSFDPKCGKFFSSSRTITRNEDVTFLECRNYSSWTSSFMLMEDLERQVNEIKIGQDVELIRKEILQRMIAGRSNMQDLFKDIVDALPKMILDMFDTLTHYRG